MELNKWIRNAELKFRINASKSQDSEPALECEFAEQTSFYLWTKIDKHWMTYFPSKTSVRNWLNIINCNMLILSLLKIANIPFSYRKRIILLSIILSEQSLLILEGEGGEGGGIYALVLTRNLKTSLSLDLWKHLIEVGEASVYADILCWFSCSKNGCWSVISSILWVLICCFML